MELKNQQPIQRIRPIFYKGKEIIFFDYRGLDDDDKFLKVAEEAVAYNLKMNRPTLQLTDITGCYLTPRIMAYINFTMPKVSHLIIKDAVVGITGAKRVLFQVYNMLAHGNAGAFTTEQAAKDWLVKE